MKIIVVGGGYAGLACLMELRRRMPDASLQLYDPRTEHLKLTHLHETVRHPLGRYRIGFGELGARLGFDHRRAPVSFDDGVARGPDGVLQYDYLVVATGAASLPLPHAADCFDRDDLCREEASRIVDQFIEDESRPPVATVVGAGASGVQFLFELADRLRAKRATARLRLIDSETRPLNDLPAAISDYVVEKLERHGIEFISGARYTGASGHDIEIEDDSGKRRLESGLTLLFAGLRAAPQLFCADRFGRLDGLANAFAAGDCARFDSRGDDSMTAQVAVRQGKHVARNIDRVARGIEPLEYFFSELGYVVSLGRTDAAGWMLLRDKLVTGLPAFAIKEAVEAQYDLFVAGLDTYLV